MRNLFWLLLLIFAPASFVKIATEDVIKKEFNTNKQLLAQFPERKLPEERRLEFHNLIKESSLKVRKSIIDSLISLSSVILGAFIFAKLAKFFWPVLSSQFISFLRLFSLSLLFWSVWGKLGWEIQTFGGQTLPEIINVNWSKSLYLSGVFLAIMSYFL